MHVIKIFVLAFSLQVKIPWKLFKRNISQWLFYDNHKILKQNQETAVGPQSSIVYFRGEQVLKVTWRISNLTAVLSLSGKSLTLLLLMCIKQLWKGYKPQYRECTTLIILISSYLNRNYKLNSTNDSNSEISWTLSLPTS